MTRVVYVNGRYLPYAKAAVHVEDRGFQFGDAVYEVCEVRDGRLVDEARHMARLARSLAELGIDVPMSAAALAHVMRETIRRNRVRHGLVYLQVTRGEGPREFTFPAPEVPPHGRVPGASTRGHVAGGRREDRHCCQDDAGHPLAPLRDQDRDAAAGVACQGGRAKRRRA